MLNNLQTQNDELRTRMSQLESELLTKADFSSLEAVTSTISAVRSVTTRTCSRVSVHSGPEKLKKSRQKNFWNQINLFFFVKSHFWLLLKLQKMEFCQKNYSWNWFIWFHEFFGVDFLKFSGTLWFVGWVFGWPNPSLIILHL